MAYEEESVPYSHAEKLTVMIQDLLAKTGLDTAALGAVAVSAGPGSYTGLRIGTSVAKGLCYALQIPLLAADTMKLLAAAAMQQGITADDMLIIPMTDARRMEVYCAVYSTALQVVEPVQAKIIDAGSFSEYSQPLLFCGDGVEKCKPLFAGRSGMHFSDIISPSAKYMGALVLQQLEQGDIADTAYFEPRYLKEFVATTPKHKGNYV